MEKQNYLRHVLAPRMEARGYHVEADSVSNPTTFVKRILATKEAIEFEKDSIFAPIENAKEQQGLRVATHGKRQGGSFRLSIELSY